MANGSVRFRIGVLDCSIISDGLLTVGPGRMELSCLVIVTGRHKVLIDTGCGVSVQVKAGKLLQNLQAEGIAASEIDLIIHTHAHSDHIGGNTDESSQPVFPNARYIIHRMEWEYWMDRLNKPQAEGAKWQPMLATARKNLLPLKDRFDIVEDSKEILPGTKFHLAPGHTPGNLVVILSSGGKQLLCVGDLIHDPLEFKKPEMYAMIDFSPEQALRSRNEKMAQAAASHTPVFACHFPYPGLGHVEQVAQPDRLFDWQPLTSGSL